MTLTVIYHFLHSQNMTGDFTPGLYSVRHCFGDQGYLSLSLLQELAKIIPNADFLHLEFSTLDDLKTFILRVGEAIEASKIRMISVEDFNIGLDGAKDLVSFQNIFLQYGEELLSEKGHKKGLWNKIFG
jgi:hypothetical protein